MAKAKFIQGAVASSTDISQTLRNIIKDETRNEGKTIVNSTSLPLSLKDVQYF
jgi:hypothetical protein